MTRVRILLLFSALFLFVSSCGSDDGRVAKPQNTKTSNETTPAVSIEPTNQQVLVAYYPFEDSANDASGNGHDGTVIGASYVSGHDGNALAFDGNDYVRIPGAGLLDALPGEAMTIEAWIKLDLFAPNRNAICEREIAGGECWPWFLMTFNDRELYGLVRGCTGAVSGPGLDRNTWYHISLVYEVVGSQAVGTLYVDGNLVGTNPNMETRNSVGGDVFIGVAMRSDYGSEDFQDFFHGIIDEVKIWSKAPSVEVYMDIKPGSCPNPINPMSKGNLPVAILGTADFDVLDIDVSSLLLEGVAAIRSYIEDEVAPLIDGNECDCTAEGADGFDDLTLKFKTQDIIAALGPIHSRDVRLLAITGNLLDGTPLEASDCIVIVGKEDPQLKEEHKGP
jgi:hypothetical protein